jgi:ankyrin repeat protein
MKKITSNQNEHKISLSESEKIFDAIQYSQYKTFALYLRHQYNLNVVSKDGRNGLFYALNIDDPYKRSRMIKFCLDHGINPLQKDKINGYTVLNETIARQQMDSFQLLLGEVSGEIDWNSFDKHGRTILHQAVEANSIPVLTALIRIMNRYYISVDVLDKNGLTPYLLAIKLHLRDMSEILLKQGHASRQKCDSQTHRTAHEWENIGMKENNLFIRRKLRQEIDDAMRKGQITKVNKLKQVYYSTSSAINEKMRRDSYLTMTTRSGLHTKSSLSINEMIDRLSEGDQPESYIVSRKDDEIFHFEHILPTSLPPLTNLKRHHPNLSFNSLTDLFQIAQLSS